MALWVLIWMFPRIEVRILSFSLSSCLNDRLELMAPRLLKRIYPRTELRISSSSSSLEGDPRAGMVTGTEDGSWLWPGDSFSCLKMGQTQQAKLSKRKHSPLNKNYRSCSAVYRADAARACRSDNRHHNRQPYNSGVDSEIPTSAPTILPHR